MPIASLTYGLTDPNPKVSGEGVRILRAAGIAVKEFGELRTELETGESAAHHTELHDWLADPSKGKVRD